MNFHSVFQRDKRYPSQMYHPMHNSVADYWTDSFQKREMKHDFSEDLIFKNIHLIPDPLKKNLADTIVNTEVPKKAEKIHMQTEKMALNDQKTPLENMSENRPKQPGATFSGIGSFFSGVMNVLTSVVFRSRSPNYYDCFDDDGHQGSYNWQSARTDVQDKNGKADDRNGFDAPSNPNESSDMNIDSRVAVTSCENKLNQVRHLLTAKQTSSPVWVRKRPKKVFVEPGSVSESFEDAFCPEDFGSLPGDTVMEYNSPLQYHCEDLCETAAQRTKLNTAPAKETCSNVQDISNKSELEIPKDQLENNQVVQNESQSEKDTLLFEKPTLDLDKEPVSKITSELETTNPESNYTKEELVSSCEDKLSKLKALLLEKRSKCRTKQNIPETSPPKTIPTDKKPVDKHFKNPNRRCSKRSKAKLKCRIEDDLVFANEISLGTPPSVENSPHQNNVNFGDYFDEVSGRFRTASTGSEDSFQIVFNECASTGRVRKSSDCDSEDSFIVFEDSPDCYVSNDVFDSDSESEVSDSGCGVTCKLAHTLTRTISNLADDSLYVESEDEVDFGGVKCNVEDNIGLALEDTSLVQEKAGVEVGETGQLEAKSGLLLDSKKKLLRKSQPAKKVHFSSQPPKVHVMRVWAFAARQARAGHWERYAIDRERFKRRIADMDMALSWVLKPQHRSRVMFQRFMPWWNQLKRKELAEKKEREEIEKRKEEQRQRDEEKRKEAEKDLERKEDNLANEEVNRADATTTLLDENTRDNMEVRQNDKPNEVKLNECSTKQDLNTDATEKQTKTADKTSLVTSNNEKQNEADKRNASDFIINDEALAKKIQDLETNDNNYNVVIS